MGEIPNTATEFLTSQEESSVWLFQLARAATTKYNHLGGLNNRNVLSCSSEGRKSQIRSQQGWFYQRAAEDMLHASLPVPGAGGRERGGSFPINL